MTRLLRIDMPDGIYHEPWAGAPAHRSRRCRPPAMDRLEGRLPDREIPADRQLRQATTVPQVEAAVCEAFGVPLETLRTKGRHDNDARRAAIYLCRELTLGSARVLGLAFGGVTAQPPARRRAKRRTVGRRRSALVENSHESRSGWAKSSELR